jgi:hypothetical protein
VEESTAEEGGVDDTDEVDENEVDEEAEVSATLEEAEEIAWAEIRSYLVTMPPYEFQALVGSLLRAMGLLRSLDLTAGR